MKYRILDVLCCPICNGPFHLEVYDVKHGDVYVPPSDSSRCQIWCALHQCPSNKVRFQHCKICYQQEIKEGKLTCEKCGNVYPIIKEIPRILPGVLLAESMVSYHLDFLERYGAEFPTIKVTEGSPSGRKSDTLHTFSYQWTTFVDNYEYFRDIFLSFVTPFLGEKDFKDRLVLEVGCGSGRPASVAASFGAEVVGLDLSEAVQTAQSLTSRYGMLHVIQGDACLLPFRPCFDFVYSVGVIQHLPDPSLALSSISKVIPPGHRLVIWVYGMRERWYRPIEYMRKITVKLPYRLLHGMSIVLAVFSEFGLLIPYRILSKTPRTRGLAERIPGRIYARFPFRENVLGWFDRLGAPVTRYFSKSDVEKMMKNCGFHEIRVTPRAGASSSWVAQGIWPKDSVQKE